jgi:hypothetical protein
MQRQLQTGIRDMAFKLAQATARPSYNSVNLARVATNARTLASLLDCDPAIVPDRLIQLHLLSLQLGAAIDVDDHVRADKSDAPLDATIREDLGVLIRAHALWLRGFAAVRELDRRETKAVSKSAMTVPALGLMAAAQSGGVIAVSDAAEVVLALQVGKDADPQHMRINRAITAAAADTANFLLAAAAIVATPKQHAIRGRTSVTPASTPVAWPDDASAPPCARTGCRAAGTAS